MGTQRKDSPKWSTEDLIEFKKLLDEGCLTEREFAALKQLVLAKAPEKRSSKTPVYAGAAVLVLAAVLAGIFMLRGGKGGSADASGKAPAAQAAAQGKAETASGTPAPAAAETTAPGVSAPAETQTAADPRAEGYTKAVELRNQGAYAEAGEAFSALDDYKDSRQQAEVCREADGAIQELLNSTETLSQIRNLLEAEDWAGLTELMESDVYVNAQKYLTAGGITDGQVQINKEYVYVGEMKDGMAEGTGKAFCFWKGTNNRGEAFYSYYSYQGAWSHNMPNGIGTDLRAYSNSMGKRVTTGFFEDWFQNGDMTLVVYTGGNGSGGTRTFHYRMENTVPVTIDHRTDSQGEMRSIVAYNEEDGSYCLSLNDTPQVAMGLARGTGKINSNSIFPKK